MQSVLHLVRPASGGIRKHVQLLAAGQVAVGMHVSIGSPENLGATSATWIPVQIGSKTRLFTDLQAARQVASAGNGFDTIHAHGLRAAWIAALSRRPFLFTAHNLAPSPSSRLVRVVFKVAAKRASSIICVSEAVANSLRQYGIERSVVVPNGIDLAAFDSNNDPLATRLALGIGPAMRVVLAVGRLAPEKGFDDLARAAHLLPAHVAVVIVGEGSERATISALARDRVKMPGYVEEVSSLIKIADVVAIPSRSEGQGLVAIEAAAARKPVVATRVGGLPETVLDGVTGLLVAPSSPGELTIALTTLLNDPDLCQRMGHAARKRAEELYSLETMVQRVMAVYQT